MNNKPVLFLDSGIGGIPYCLDFLKRNERESVYYLADNKNFPYGTRKKEELISCLTALTEKLLKSVKPKIIVLACNTATVSALEYLRENFPQIPFVGTVPAIKPAAKASKNGKVGVLGTERTIEDPYNRKLAMDGCEIIGIAAPELVEFVEHHFDETSEDEKTKMVKKYINLFRAKNADTLVLGCTHFLYLLEEFRREAAPYIKIFDSLDGITKRIEYLLDENDCSLRAEEISNPERRLLLTGETADSLWQNRLRTLGFTLDYYEN